MVLLLCAIVRPGTPSQGLERLDRDRVSVLYEIRDGAPRPEQDEVLRFGDVVQRVARDGAVLPVRFGTVVEDLAALEALARDREVGWDHRLDVVSGHVEMVVHAREPQPVRTQEPPPSGRDYLLARAAAHRHDEEVRAGLLGAAGVVARETRVLRGREETRLACLVPAGAEEALGAAVQEWVDAGAGRQVLVTGPWPPFSFTDDPAVPADTATDASEVPA